MWCGSAADEVSQGFLKVGWHRVEKTFVEPRLTMWYEVCTYEQVPQRFLSNNIEPTKEVRINGQSNSVVKNWLWSSQEANLILPVINYPLVQVKTLTGRFIELPSTLNSASKVEDVQDFIQDKEGIPPSKQRLMYMSRILASERTLGFYGYESGQIIYLILSLRAGNFCRDDRLSL